jgi:hypothetical protein
MAVGDFAVSGCCLRGSPLIQSASSRDRRGRKVPSGLISRDAIRALRTAPASGSLHRWRQPTPQGPITSRPRPRQRRRRRDSRYPSNDKAAPGPAAGQADRDHDRPCTLEAELRQEPMEGPLDQVAAWPARTTAGAVTSTAGLGAGPRSRLASRTPRARRPTVAARPGPPRGRSPGPSGRRRRCLPRDPPTRSCRSDRVTSPRCELNRGSGSGKVSGPGVACSTL